MWWNEQGEGPACLPGFRKRAKSSANARPSSSVISPATHSHVPNESFSGGVGTTSMLRAALGMRGFFMGPRCTDVAELRGDFYLKVPADQTPWNLTPWGPASTVALATDRPRRALRRQAGGASHRP